MSVWKHWLILALVIKSSVDYEKDQHFVFEKNMKTGFICSVLLLLSALSTKDIVDVVCEAFVMAGSIVTPSLYEDYKNCF